VQSQGYFGSLFYYNKYLMQVNIYIQDQLYKTVDVAGDSYNLGEIMSLVEIDKSQGLLSRFDESKGLGIRVEPVVD